MYSRQGELIQSSAIILVWLIYFPVVHLKKGDTFYIGSDGANYVRSNISDVEKCLIFISNHIPLDPYQIDLVYKTPYLYIYSPATVILFLY